MCDTNEVQREMLEQSTANKKHDEETASKTNLRQDSPPFPQEEQGRVRKLVGVKWFLFNVTTLTPMFLYGVDNTIVANIAPTIVQTFSAVPQLPWLSVGFMIGGLAFAMPLSKLYALYDAKYVYLACTVLFMAASALCGAAPSMNAEIVGRVFAGAGGNGVYFGLLNLVSINTTNAERPGYLGLAGAVWGIGTVLGPILGGSFALSSWRWGFYLNLFLAIWIIPASIYLIPSATPRTGTNKTPFQRLYGFDWLGALLSIAGCMLIVVAINLGGVQFDWDSSTSIALLTASSVVWLAFMLQQSFCILTTVQTRMFPMHLFRKKEVALLFPISCCVSCVCYVPVYYIPLYFQFTRGDSPVQTAVRLLPYIIFLCATMLSSGFLMGRWGYHKPSYVIGASLALVGAVLMSSVRVSTSNGKLYGFQILLGTGAGTYTQAGLGVIQAILPPTETANGVTIMLIAQLSGMSLGLSVAGALFINFSENGLMAALPQIPEDQIRQIVAGTSSAIYESLPVLDRKTILQVIVDAEAKVFTFVYVCAAISLSLGIFLSNKRVFVPVTV